MDALLGSQEWRPFHKGSFGTKIVGCSRAITAVRARVRAYRSGGARGAPQLGPWSNASAAMRLLPFVEGTKVEIAEIPGAWAAVDVAGVEELDERKVGPEELRPLLNIPYSPVHPRTHPHTPVHPRTPPYPPPPFAGRSRGACAAQTSAAFGDARAPHGHQATAFNTLARLPLAPTTRPTSWPSATAPLTTPLTTLLRSSSLPSATTRWRA